MNTKRAPWWAYPDDEYRPFDFVDKFGVHPLVPGPGEIVTPEQRREHRLDGVIEFLGALRRAREIYVEELGTDHRYVWWIDEEIALASQWVRDLSGPGNDRLPRRPRRSEWIR